MKIFNFTWIVICIIFMMLVMAGCEENVQEKEEFDFDFPEVEVEIVAPDSSEIFVPSQELMNALNDTINPTSSFTQFIHDPNNKIFILLHLAENSKDSILKLEAQNNLSNIAPDSVNWKKSLLGDYYKYVGEQEEDWELKVEHFKKAAIYFEASLGSLSEDYLDMIYEVGAAYSYDLLDYNVANFYVIRNIELREIRDENSIELSLSYQVAAYISYNQEEYMMALCYIKMASDSFQSSLTLHDEANSLYQLGERELAYDRMDELFMHYNHQLDSFYQVFYHSHYAQMLFGARRYLDAEKEYKIAEKYLSPNYLFYDEFYRYFFVFLLRSEQYVKLIQEVSIFLERNLDNVQKAYFHNLLSVAYEKINNIELADHYSTLALSQGFNLSNDIKFPSIKQFSNDHTNDGLDILVNYLRISTQFNLNNGSIVEATKTLDGYKLIDSLFDRALKLSDDESKLHNIDHYTRIFSEAINGYYGLSKLGVTKKNQIIYYMNRTKAVLLRNNTLESNDGLKRSKLRSTLTKMINFEFEQVKKNYEKYDNYTFLLKCVNENKKYSNQTRLSNIQPKKNQVINNEALKNCLFNKNMQLMAYYSFDTILFGIGMKDEFFKFNKWTLDSSEMAQFIYLKEMMRQSNSDEIEEVGRYEILAFNIFQQYVQPLISDSNIENIAIIPSGPLMQLPIEALITKNTISSSFGDLTYVIHDHSLHYYYTLDQIFFDFTKNNLSEEDMVLFSYSDINSISDENTSNLEELPGTIIELSKIKKAIPLAKNNIFSGEECTKYAFINNIENTKIIHLATHATSDNSSRRLNRIYFRQENSENDSSLWTLTPGEITRLDISSDLVFLSACETGMGRTYEGEGIYNLGRSFLSAGAKNVIQSYWTLDDNSAAEIVGNFYKYYQHTNKCTSALRQSKLDYINKWPDQSHPYYWSGVF